jgi:multidrug efflux pump subunit AcrA (membrane-fusion protein)
MTGHHQRLSSLSQTNSRSALYAFTIIALLAVASSGCQSQVSSDNPASPEGIIIVNAPAAGEIRRVLVSEGMSVNKDAPVVEIAVPTEAPPAPQTQTEDPQARAARNIQASKTEVDAARAEVVRTEIEVQRLTPLVASGQATQAELDGARALYERAQQRFQKAQEAAQGAQSGLVAARQQSQNSSSALRPAPTEQLVVARASAAGTVKVINARVGDRVVAGQALATLRAD